MEISHGLSACALIFLSCFLFVFFSSNPFSTFSFNPLTIPQSKLGSQKHLTISNDVRDGSVEDRFRDVVVIRKAGKLREEEVLEQGLARARAAIRKAMKNNASSPAAEDDQDAPRGFVYRNPSPFYQSYIEMEKRFKVYVYEEGEMPIVHGGPCKNIYTSEGGLIHEMELGKTKSEQEMHDELMFISSHSVLP